MYADTSTCLEPCTIKPDYAECAGKLSIKMQPRVKAFYPHSLHHAFFFLCSGEQTPNRLALMVLSGSVLAPPDKTQPSSLYTTMHGYLFLKVFTSVGMCYLLHHRRLST